MKFNDLSGQTFGSWFVLYRTEERPEVRFMCRCECGTEKSVRGYSLEKGESKSCGCKSVELTREKRFVHGMFGTPEYNTWQGLRTRCNNPKDKSYHNYGGRGIKVCDEWNSFTQFLKDMGKKPSSKHTIDRIDNMGDYCAANCRWATCKEQNNNRRSNLLIEYKGETKTLKQWAEFTGLNHSTIASRLQEHGWSVEDALTVPARAKAS